MTIIYSATFLICLQLIEIIFAHMSVDDFYPFGNETGDDAMFKNDDSSTPFIPISTDFPFFNHQQNRLIVNTNGAISFLKPVSTFTPSPFPLDDDRRLLTPFWVDVDTRKGGTVWYRETTDKSIRDRATAEIRKYFPEFLRFSATWIFLATWDNVAFYGCSVVGCKKRNTFQAILVTNGQHSFTIFNYADITWTTGTASGGDRNTGLGGTPAQVGFNTGDGYVFYAVPSSRQPDIIHINEKSNVNEPGKFVFRIDSSKIRNGGCNTDGSLTITPRYGPMLGGQYLVVSGPCLEDSTDIQINYSNMNKSFPCERKSNLSMVCITPMFSTTGDIDVFISVQSQMKVKYFNGHYKILNPADSKINVFRHDELEWTNGQHEISWNKDAFEFAHNMFVDIHAFTIKEEGQMFRWKKTIIKENVQRQAGRSYIDLNLSESIVALRVTSRIQQSQGMPDRGIWSDIFPVVPTQHQAMHQCENWIRKQYHNPWIPHNVEPCPCTLQQALLDIVRYQPDPDCNMLTTHYQQQRIPSCLYRKNAKHCVRLARPRQDGSDNVCCYDENDNLIDARDKEGGTIQRYHFRGGDGNVPYISNFYHDVVPYLDCCRYSQRIEDGPVVYSLCQDFLYYRKQSSCKNYVPPRPARTSGDPHITTIDGFGYTFNGACEFYYLLTMDREFISQIRFEQFRINGILVDASVATAFAAKIANVTVEARVNSIRTLDIVLNGKQLEMEETPVLRYDGVSIVDVTSHMDGDIQRKDYLLIFPSVGISFKLYGSKSLLNIIPVIANDDLKGKIRGLLGNYDDDESNDLITSSNTTLAFNSSSQKIYHDFGMTWATNNLETIFSYEEGKSFDYYHIPGFTPVFVPPQLHVPETIKTTCKNDTECIFDFQVTGSTEIATTTREVGDLFRVQEDVAQTVPMCDDVPTSSNDSNGRWVSSNGAMNGSIASFKCMVGYYMNSTYQETVMCNNGSWQTAFGNFSCQLNDTYVNKTIERKRGLPIVSLTSSEPTANEPTNKPTTTTTTTSGTAANKTTTKKPTTTTTTTSGTTANKTTTNKPTTTTSGQTTTNKPTTNKPTTTTTTNKPTATTTTTSATTTNKTTTNKPTTTTTTTSGTTANKTTTNKPTTTTNNKPTTLTKKPTTNKPITSKSSTISTQDIHSTSQAAADVTSQQSIGTNKKLYSDDKNMETEINMLRFMWISLGGGLAFTLILITVVSLTICYRIRSVFL